MADQTEGAGPAGAPGGPGGPSEEEVRAQLEEEIKKVKISDVIVQSLVSILNLTARRIAKDDERDLEQGKQGIDVAQAMLEHVPEEVQDQLRQAISELQLLYANGGKPPEGGPGGGPAAPEGGAPGAGGEAPEGGGSQPSGVQPSGGDQGGGGLWTPHER